MYGEESCSRPEGVHGGVSGQAGGSSGEVMEHL